MLSDPSFGHLLTEIIKMSTNQNKVVAKNSIIMFIRMIFLMGISFYTSRLLLSTLGVTDFGVFSVVGSLSSTFIAIKSLFSESIQRFLNVAKGKGNAFINEQISIFNMSIIVHVVLVLVFIVLVEFIGIWLLENKLNIPIERMEAARFVFQMTVLATSISILSIPYDAVIIANEKLGVYAGITIFDAILKLFFIIALPFMGFDYLKAYSVFLVFIPLSTLVIQLFYCRHFPECKYSFKLDKKLFVEVMSLSSWNFFGNVSFSIIHEGINMLLNMYGGVVLNAARSISYQVRNATNQLSTNTLIAVRPRIMQQSVQKSKEDFIDNIFLISRISYFSLSIAIVPIFVFCPYLLDIWLDEVPSSSVMFTRILLVGLFLRTLHEPINIMNMAFAKIKNMMIIETLVMLLTLLLIYFVLKSFGYIWLPFTLLSCMEMVIVLCLIINAKYEIQFPISLYGKKVLAPMLLFAIASACIGFIFAYVAKPSTVLHVILLVLLSCFVEMIICWLFFNERERNIVIRLVKTKANGR